MNFVVHNYIITVQKLYIYRESNSSNCLRIIMTEKKKHKHKSKEAHIEFLIIIFINLDNLLSKSFGSSPCFHLLFLVSLLLLSRLLFLKFLSLPFLQIICHSYIDNLQIHKKTNKLTRIHIPQT